jgi:hypothetical protein
VRTRVRILENLFHGICEYKNLRDYINLHQIIIRFVPQILSSAINIAKKICTDEQLESEADTNRVLAIVHSHDGVKLA